MTKRMWIFRKKLWLKCFDIGEYFESKYNGFTPYHISVWHNPFCEKCYRTIKWIGKWVGPYIDSDQPVVPAWYHRSKQRVKTEDEMWNVNE